MRPENENTIVDAIEPATPGRRLSLMVYHRDGVDVLPLIDSNPIVIGRAAPSTLTPRSRRLSRQHARFELFGEEVMVTDLESTNGTFMNGDRIRGRHPMGPGDEVVMGSVSVTVNMLSDVERGGGALASHEKFLVLLDEELVQAKVALRPVSVLMVRSADPDLGPSQWVSQLREILGGEIQFGLYAQDTVELILPKSMDEAVVVGRQITDPEGGEINLLCGIASYPEHGTTADNLNAAVRTAVLRANPHAPNQIYSSGIVWASEDDAEGPVVRDVRMLAVYETIDRVAKSSISVVIHGETGVGKEVVARAIHDRSDRAHGPLRCINCGAIPATLLESVLFGHERGSFTGADRQSHGVFEESDGGTLLLDEIGELSAQAQVALLRVLETKRISRVGSTREVSVDVRVLAATHRDLEGMCELGTFRWDLLYRLNTITVEIPPLRERPADIRPLVMRFIHEANVMNGRFARGVTPDAMMLLETYSWPGNVRELRNCIDRAVVVAAGEVVTVDELPMRVRAHADELARQAARTIDVSRSAWPFRGKNTSDSTLDLKERVHEFEIALIKGALRACHGNQTSAAQLLRIPRRTLVYKLRAHKNTIEVSDPIPNLAVVDTASSELDFRERVGRFEAKMIREAVRRALGDHGVAAQLLGIQKRTLEQKMQKYAIQ
jgi:DNA-binding NtrC family response regulator